MYFASRLRTLVPFFHARIETCLVAISSAIRGDVHLRAAWTASVLAASACGSPSALGPGDFSGSSSPASMMLGRDASRRPSDGGARGEDASTGEDPGDPAPDDV